MEEQLTPSCDTDTGVHQRAKQDEGGQLDEQAATTINDEPPATSPRITEVKEVKCSTFFSSCGKSKISDREVRSRLTKNQAKAYPLLEENGAIIRVPKKLQQCPRKKKDTQKLFEHLSTDVVPPQQVSVIKLRPKVAAAKRSFTTSARVEGAVTADFLPAMKEAPRADKASIKEVGGQTTFDESENSTATHESALHNDKKLMQKELTSFDSGAGGSTTGAPPGAGGIKRGGRQDRLARTSVNLNAEDVECGFRSDCSSAKVEDEQRPTTSDRNSLSHDLCDEPTLDDLHAWLAKEKFAHDACDPMASRSRTASGSSWSYSTTDSDADDHVEVDLASRTKKEKLDNSPPSAATMKNKNRNCHRKTTTTPQHPTRSCNRWRYTSPLVKNVAALCALNRLSSCLQNLHLSSTTTSGDHSSTTSSSLSNHFRPSSGDWRGSSSSTSAVHLPDDSGAGGGGSAALPAQWQHQAALQLTNLAPRTSPSATGSCCFLTYNWNGPSSTIWRAENSFVGGSPKLELLMRTRSGRTRSGVLTGENARRTSGVLAASLPPKPRPGLLQQALQRSLARIKK
ncbi:unnamed protein product [Amoebophrya sp. A120]|nr:unnamed protein product [Amoebophrya sp. A120]|eukprot:GSA120T00020071001.1